MRMPKIEKDEKHETDPGESRDGSISVMGAFIILFIIAFFFLFLPVMCSGT